MNEHDHSRQHRDRRRLTATLAVTAMIMVTEVVGGFWSGSLSLLADAGHMLTDAFALLIALAAVTFSALPANDRRTYGYRRLEILAALVNGLVLGGVAVSIFLKGFDRWLDPREISTPVMAAVAAVGLVANLFALWLLGGHQHNLNIRGAFLHILGDTLSSVGVLAAAGIIALTGWYRIDAVVSFAIGLVIIITTFRLLRDVVDVLLESAPRHIDTDAVRRAIYGVDGVLTVCDLHVWSITSSLPALSAHVVVSDPTMDRDQVLLDIRQVLQQKFSIFHSTLQVESNDHDQCYCRQMGGPDDHLTRRPA